MSNQSYDRVSLDSYPRSTFDQSHYRSLTLNQGKLVPIFCKDVLPGDTFNLQTTSMVRLFPMDVPIFQEMDLFIHFFYVPIRQVWDSFEDFITQSHNGKSLSVIPIPPYLSTTTTYLTAFHPGNLLDNLGYPSKEGSVNIPSTHRISTLPIRCYAAIYNYWYRDENLVDEIIFPLTSGADSATVTALQNSSGDATALLRRAWEKDYFTSALPFAQKGAPVSLPLATKPISVLARQTSRPPMWVNIDGNEPNGAATFNSNGELANSAVGINSGLYMLPNENLYVDPSSLSNATINDLRDSVALQRFREIMSQGGSRYTEYLLSMYGVQSDDLRLQRPMYLGGGKQQIQISEVLQTSQSTPESPQGSYAGHGFSIGDTIQFNETFKEHGYIIGIASIMPKAYYFQGLPKHLTRFDTFDYALPLFANLGEQPVKNKELFYNFADTSKPEDTFGYQQRYCEYKDTQSSIHGDFKTSLLFWHQARDFSAQPGLNKTFIECNPSQRIFPTEGNNVAHFYAHLRHNLSITRLLPTIAKPGLL